MEGLNKPINFNFNMSITPDQQRLAVDTLKVGVAGLLITKAISCILKGGVNALQDRAHEIVLSAKRDVEQGNYLVSWVRIVPARLWFAGDGIVKAACVPFRLVETSLRAIQCVYTWGATSQKYNDAAIKLINDSSSVIRGVLGAVISPTIAYDARNDNMVAKVANATLMLSADSHHYNPKTDSWSYGWNRRFF
jgi:hypothetical protein